MATSKTTTTTESSPSATAKLSRAATGKPKVPAPAANESENSVIVSQGTGAEGGAALNKIELIDLVVEKSGVKKKFAKPVIEATLRILGEQIAEGREMHLQPLGRVKYNRVTEKENARVVIMKLRQKKPGVVAGSEADADSDTDAVTQSQ